MPFLLLIYLTDHYEYGGGIIRIHPEKTVYVLIFALIAISLLMIAKNARDSWDRDDISQEFSMWVPVAIIAFQRFSGSGNIMLTDMHHPAENTIAFNEIVNLGREAFSEYVPVSGLYGFVQGLFLEVFGNGNYTSYSIANNVYYLVVIILLVAALRLHVNPLLTFLCSLFISVSDYSRVALILPFMLFLLSRKLIDNANIWAMAWVMLSLCYGLYYPAYGAAVLVALIPLGIYQIPRMIGEYKRWPVRKRCAASFGWLLVLAAVALSSPLLMGTLEHVLAMGDGMLYVDGVTVFGKALPGDFFGYLKTDSKLYTIRMALGYIVRFSGPMIVVWIAACAFFQTVHAMDGRTWKNVWFKLTVEEMSILACLLFSVVCFYFSLYRMGAGTLFNRTVHIINYAAILLIIILYEYDSGCHDRHLLIFMAVFVCALCNLTGIDGLAGKYYSRYRVAEDYVYTEGRDDMPHLGEGFVQQDQMKRLEDAASKYGQMDPDRNYFALFADGLHGMAYDQILNIKGTSMLETMMARGYGITADTAKKLCESEAIVGNKISPVDHYYLYKWLLTGGEYRWSGAYQVFYPVAGETKEDVRSANADVVVSMPSDNVGRYAASLGNSIETLGGVLTEQDEYSFAETGDAGVWEMSFDGLVDGNEVDYIYVSLDMDDDVTPILMGEDHKADNRLEAALMKHEYHQGMQLVAEWLDDHKEEHVMRMAVENGRLLIPVGAGAGWLNNSHSHVRLWLEKDGEMQGFPAVDEIRLFRLRDLP